MIAGSASAPSKSVTYPSSVLAFAASIREWRLTKIAAFLLPFLASWMVFAPAEFPSSATTTEGLRLKIS